MPRGARPFATAILLGGSWLTGCQCGFDAGKLDAIACSTSANCPPERDCVEGLCVQRACERSEDCGDPALFACDGGWCVALPASDGGPGTDAGADGGPGGDAGVDGGPMDDAGVDGGPADDAGVDGGADGGPCVPDSECDDGDPCTSGDRCTDGACAGSPYSCDDSLACTNEVCDGAGGCETTVADGVCLIDGACWVYADRDPEDQCVACVPDTDRSQWTRIDGWLCDDGDPCSFGDECDQGACVATAYSCDDGLSCTDDVCDGLGGCENPLVDGHCSIDGACWIEGDPSPLNGCEECAPDSDPHGWTLDATNQPDDGIACTVDDCSSGSPVHRPADDLCNGGDVCAICAGGCVPVPPLTVDCPVGWHVPGDETCTLDTGGIADQAACLSCKSAVGITQLWESHFTGCDQAGWTITRIVEGVNLPQPECPAAGELGPDTTVAEDQLQFRSNSITAMTAFANTTDYDSVRACFDLAEVRMNADDVVRVIMSFDWDTPVEQWTPVASFGEPVPGTDFNWTRVCVDLGEGSGNDADDRPAVGFGLRVEVRHALGDPPAMVFIDNFVLEGWRSAYLTRPGRVIDDDFSGCPADLDGWDPGGVDPVVCPATAGALAGQDTLEALDAQWTLTKTVDLSDRCGQIEVGFANGTRGAELADQTIVTWQRGFGSSRLWASNRATGPEETLSDFVMSLSAVDWAIPYAQDVTLRFDVRAYEAPEGDGILDGIFLDDIWVDGARCEHDDGAIFTIDAPVEQNDDYVVTVSSDEQATAWIGCVWDGRAETLTRDLLVFSDWGE